MLHLFGHSLPGSPPYRSLRSLFRSFFHSTLRAIAGFWPAPHGTLPCSPASAVTPTWWLCRDCSLEWAGGSSRAAQPRWHILRQTAALIAAEASAPATGSAHWLKSQSANRRAAPTRDKRNRNTRV